MKCIITLLFFLTTIALKSQDTTLYPGNKLQYIGILDTDGQRTGEWQEFYESGHLKEAGFYSNGHKVGEWRSYFENGQLMIRGDYEPPFFRTGQWLEYYENGQLSRTGTYKSGLEVGEWITYFQNGQLSSTGTFEVRCGGCGGPGCNSHKLGEWRYYYESGSLKEKGSYVYEYNRNKKFGEWKYYDEKGLLKEIVVHGVNESSVSEWKSRENFEKKPAGGELKIYYKVGGPLKEIGLYENGERMGEWNEYYWEGNVKSNGRYVRDRKTGKWKTYYGTGELMLIESFVNGERK